MNPHRSSDLPAEVFLILRDAFFDASGNSVPYPLREKRNTQDDPFDEYVHNLLVAGLPADARALKAPGPLITPDLIVLRPEMCDGRSRLQLGSDLTRIFGVEVKKLERTPGDGIARASGMDYNTTPPCGTVRVYGADNLPLDIRGFYLFVCQEPVVELATLLGGQPGGGRYRLSALVLCDGNLLNSDFDLYLSIVGARTKAIGLGTFGDGANRNRPMLIFTNPLGIAELGCTVTLLHARENLHHEVPQLRFAGTISRTPKHAGLQTFHCYRLNSDLPEPYTPFQLVDPFPVPVRSERTTPRGRFRINVRPGD